VLFYMQYKYLFKNSENSNKAYKITQFVFEDYVNDFIDIIHILFKSFKIKINKYWFLSWLNNMLTWVIRMFCKVICKIWFFLSYYVYI